MKSPGFPTSLLPFLLVALIASCSPQSRSEYLEAELERYGEVLREKDRTEIERASSQRSQAENRFESVELRNLLRGDMLVADWQRGTADARLTDRRLSDWLDLVLAAGLTELAKDRMLALLDNEILKETDNQWFRNKLLVQLKNLYEADYQFEKAQVIDAQLAQLENLAGPSLVSSTNAGNRGDTSLNVEMLDPSLEETGGPARGPFLRVYQPDPLEYQQSRGVVRVKARNYDIKGFVHAYEGLQSLTVNGEPVELFPNGLWVYPTLLLEGTNSFVLEARSKGDRTVRDTLRIVYADQSVEPGEAPTRWLLAIAVDEYDYQDLPDLDAPVRDARRFVRVMTDKFGFRVSDTLFNVQANRENLKESLKKLIRQTRPNDQVAVYFAGHGEYDPDFDAQGYWMLADAPWGNSSNLAVLDRLAANQLLVVADACFAGSLYRPTGNLDPFEERARWLLASGRLELVPDILPGEEHSPFAFTLLQYLQELDRPETVYQTGKAVEAAIAAYSSQRPLVRPLPGDQGGEWVFEPVK